MSDVMVKIRAHNETARGFAEVKRDAVAAAGAVEASSRRAGGAVATYVGGLGAIAKSSAMAANQQRNLVFQLNDVAVSLASGANPLMVFAQQGSQIATIYGPEEGGLGKALKETGNLAVGLVSKFWPIAAVVGAGTAAIAGMQAEINKTSDTQVSFGDVAMASWQVFADGIYSLAQPAITAVAGWLGDMWEMAWPIIHQTGNAIIATFVGAFDASKEVWSAFPAVMGDFTISTVNNVIGGVESMINGAIGLVNDFKSTLGFEGDLGAVSFSGVENPYEGALSGVGDKVAGAFQNAFKVDYLGNLFGAIKGKAVALAEASASAGEAMKGAAKSVEPLSLGLEAANDNASKLGETLANSLTQGVMSIWQAFRSGENVLEAISTQLMNFADQLLSSAISGFFGNIFGSALGGGGFPNLSSIGGFGSYGSFASGGDFTVGGAGATDSQLVSFMATPGEHVSVRTPGQMAGGGSSDYLDVRVSIDVQNGNIVPLVTRISGQVAGKVVEQQGPAMVARTQRNRALG